MTAAYIWEWAGVGVEFGMRGGEPGAIARIVIVMWLAVAKV
jgi:uncharacterized membrane protein YhiD involved in acid resistance